MNLASAQIAGEPRIDSLLRLRLQQRQSRSFGRSDTPIGRVFLSLPAWQSLTLAASVDKVLQVAFRLRVCHTSDNVSELSGDTAGTVLHIRPQGDRYACANEMTLRLASAPVLVDTCPDVYRALARICKAPERTHRAAIVCLDALVSAELEFFSVIARARPCVSVYVYGDASGSSRESRAIELGATGILTDDVIHNLGISDEPPHTDVSVEQPSPSTDESTSPRRDERTTVGRMETVHGEDSDDDPSEPPRDDHLSGSVQVPWVNRAEGPVRRRTPNQSETEEVSEPAKSPEERLMSEGLHEPLLTDEELRALVGDDILSITPEDHLAPGDHHLDGNGGGV